MSDEPTVPEMPQATNPSASRTSKPKLDVPEGGFKEWPEFDPEKYRAPRINDFENPIVYLEHKKTGLVKRVEDIDAEIAEIKQFGYDPEARKQRNRVKNTTSRFKNMLQDGQLTKEEIADMMALMAQASES